MQREANTSVVARTGNESHLEMASTNREDPAPVVKCLRLRLAHIYRSFVLWFTPN